MYVYNIKMHFIDNDKTINKENSNNNVNTLKIIGTCRL